MTIPYTRSGYIVHVYYVLNKISKRPPKCNFKKYYCVVYYHLVCRMTIINLLLRLNYITGKLTLHKECIKMWVNFVNKTA